MENGTQRCQSASQVCLCLDVYSVDAGHDAGKPLAILCDLCAACRVTLLPLSPKSGVEGGVRIRK